MHPSGPWLTFTLRRVTGPKLTRQGSAPLRPCPSLPLSPVPEASEQPSSGGPSEDGGAKAAAQPPAQQGAPVKQEVTAAGARDNNLYGGVAAAAASSNGRSGRQSGTDPGADDSSPYAIFAQAAGAQPASAAGVKTGPELHAASNGTPGAGVQATSNGNGAARSTNKDASAAAASHREDAEPVTELDGGANPYSRFLM